MQRAETLTGQGGGSGMRAAGAVLAIAAAATLSACAEVQQHSPFNLPPVNPSSPIAPYAEQVSRENFATPSFTQVPPKIVDVRPPAAYKTAVIDEVQQRRDIAAWLAAHPQLTNDTEGYAAKELARIPGQEKLPVTPQRDAEAEAFAKRLREQAQQPAPQQ
jgi:hypothetical protein